MPRRKRRRCINYLPCQNNIWVGVNRGEVYLKLDEIEALRLSDYLNLTHNEAAKIMNISRPTFTRILNQARVKIAKALIEGLSVSILKNENEIYLAQKYNKRFRWAKKLD